MLKIATWNVNSIKMRLGHLAQWLDEHQPDILAIQETKTIDEQFPRQEIEEMGYQAIFFGQKTYNGVAILSKPSQGMSQAVVKNIRTFDDPQARVIAASYGKFRIINVYVPNGQSVNSEKFHYKLAWLSALQEFLTEELIQHEMVVVLGDFNIAPTDDDVYDPIAWQGSVLVSPEERKALADLMQLGFHDCFRLFQNAKGLYSWWDYRAAAFRRNMGLRIDHILINKALVPKCSACYIDTQPRKWEKPSDHAIVVAEFS